VFSIALQTSEKPVFFRVQTVSVDSLPEAEILALKAARKHFMSKQVMIVHRGNLIYDIYEIFEPIGRIKIKTM